MVSNNSRYVFSQGKWRLFTCLLVVLTCVAHGASVQELYSDEVPVLSHDDAGRQQAMKIALEKVLVRVTGKEAVTDHPEIKKAMAEPAPYISGFSYHRKASEDGIEQQWLKISFDKISVDRLLTAAENAIWGASRPETMILLAISKDNERHIIHSGSTSPVVSSVHSYFHELSMPVFFPLMDVEDTRNISIADVWGLFGYQLMQSASRYKSDTVLAGRLYQKNGLYSGELSLFFRNQRYNAPPINNLDSAGLAKVAASLTGEVLSSYYAVASTATAEKQVIVIEGIQSLKSYAGMVGYLEKLNGISDVNVQSVIGDRVIVGVDFPGSLKKLEDAIALGKKLKLKTYPSGVDSVSSIPENALFPDKRLYYRWVGR
ncbi:hypothetical protein CI610_00304 [invertebrate metagenome]|uniref:DUF2066 domain-containing protein n=1 Tax=invertebrate metagenome TaxID=1711999 RepID=A0A2H9TBX8_9ZZZZ